MNTATLNLDSNSHSARIRVMNAERLRMLFEKYGELSIQNLVKWVRMLVRLVLAPFRLVGGMLLGRESGSREGDIRLPAAGAGAGPDGQREGYPADPSIDMQAFANESQTGALADEEGAGESANDEVASFACKIAEGQKDMEIELTGLPEELLAIQKQLLSMLEPIMAAGYSFAGEEGLEANLLAYMGEEAQRIRYVQQLSVKQMVFLAQKVAETHPGMAGLSTDSVIRHTNKLRLNSTEIQEGGLYQLAVVLGAEEKIRSGYERHVAAAAALLAQYQGSISVAAYEKLEKAFQDGVVSAEIALMRNEREIRDGLSGEQNSDLQKIPVNDVLFYTVKTPTIALKFAISELAGHTKNGIQESIPPVSSAVVPEMVQLAAPPIISTVPKGQVKVEQIAKQLVPSHAGTLAPIATATVVPAVSGFGNRSVGQQEKAMQDAAGENDGLASDDDGLVM